MVLFWHLLTREEDYAFARPAMTRKKIRQLELLAGAPPRKGKAGVAGNFANRHVREAERELSGQAEAAYRRLQRLARERTEEEGCGRDTGTRIFSAVKAASRAAGSMSPNGLLFASSVTRTRPRPSSAVRRHAEAAQVRIASGIERACGRRGRVSTPRLGVSSRLRWDRAR